MKKLLFFLIFLPFVSLFGQGLEFSFFFPNIGGFFKKAFISVQNGTPFQIGVIAMGEDLGFLSPGESFFDEEPVAHEGMHLPLLASIYDAGGNFLGTAARTLSLSAGQPATWTVRTNDIIWAANGYGYHSYYPAPAPDTSPRMSRGIDFPRAWYQSTTMLQVINASLFTLVVKLNGIEVTRLRPGEIFYKEIKDPGILVHSAVVKVVYLDRGRWAGESEEKIIFTTKGPPQAYQYIFGPLDRRW